MTQIRSAPLPTDLARTDASQAWTGTQDFTGATVLGVTGPGGTSPDATTTSKGLVQLAGDLAGTAAAPTVPGLAAKVNTSALAAVATSGAYTDLTGRPALATVATSGAYTDLTGRPALAAVATSGAYTDLTGAPPVVKVAYKGSATNITNSTTKLADPDLAFATVATGTYVFEVEGTHSCAVSNVGLGWGIGGTATVTGPNYGTTTSAASAGATPTAGLASVATGGTVSNSGGTGTLRLAIPLTVTAAGSVAFTWAQSVSNASAMTLNAGSWARLTKVA